MINIGTTDFFIGVPCMPRNEFEMYSTRLFDEWEAQVDKTLTLSDYSIALELEEGSVKGVGKIAACLGALYIGIGQYGSFTSGLKTIGDQVGLVGDFLAKRSVVPFASSRCETRIRKRKDSLTQLQRLFVKVQRREITTEQAMSEAEALFGDEATTAPEFMHKLQESFKQAPLLPQQLKLFPDAQEQDAVVPHSEKERRPRPPRPIPFTLPPDKFRVEVWRESKTGQRRVRVIQL